MVAHAVSQSQSAFRGVRAFDPSTDLNGVAHLLEEAFRSERTFPFSTMPLLREVGVVLWTLNYAPVLPSSASGFVWVEDKQILGNVSLSLDDGRLDRYYVSNVAVKPSHRRRGIARAMIQAAIGHLRGRNAKTVLLNVRPQNSSAVKLYSDLGFQEIEMRGEWTRPTARPSDSFSTMPFPRETGQGAIRPLRPGDARAVAELVRAATPANVQPYRPPQIEFGLAWDERIVERVTDLFIGQMTQRWVLEDRDKLAALLTVRGQRIASFHQLAIQVRPEFRERVEDDLIAFGLRELARSPYRPVRAPASSTHPELIAALERHGFTFLNGMTLMALTL